MSTHRDNARHALNFRNEYSSSFWEGLLVGAVAVISCVLSKVSCAFPSTTDGNEGTGPRFIDGGTFG